MVWGSLVANVSAEVLLVIKMRKMQEFKNAKYARMRGMITTAKSREVQGREGRAVGGKSGSGYSRERSVLAGIKRPLLWLIMRATRSRRR